MRFKRSNIVRFVLAFIIVVILVKILSVAKKLSSSRREVARPHNDRYEKLIHKHSSGASKENGDLGKPVHLAEDEKEKAKKIYAKKAINLLASEKIPLRRELPDVRNPLCRDVRYDATLPTASVIIIFYDEGWSVLLRTVHSVLSETWPNQLKEIILVDDHSEEEDLKGLLDYYIRTRLPKNVRLLRLPERQGLIKARLEGARNATGDALFFLDAHCEVTKGWLPPLLQRIKENRNAVAIPLIDVISEATLEYQVFEPKYVPIGGFMWRGDFIWTDMPEREMRSRASSIAPVKTPTMAGGLFAIDRRYFWEVGSYDDKMDGWGGENLEMSFRIWQCGGSLEIIPCSRVGHIFRQFMPYRFPGDKDTYLINTARLAHVWMDEYKRLFFLHHSQLKDNTTAIGDVSERLELRSRLRCKSFKWYLRNIYPEKFVPDEGVQVFGRARLRDRNLCLDSLRRDAELPYNVSVNRCEEQLTPSQYFSMTESETLRKEDMCASVAKDALAVEMTACGKHRERQRWKLRQDGTIMHVQSGLCLDATGLIDKENVVASDCYRTPGQFWKFDYSGNDIPPD